jgi:hypothetical protein
MVPRWGPTLPLGIAERWHRNLPSLAKERNPGRPGRIVLVWCAQNSLHQIALLYYNNEWNHTPTSYLFVVRYYVYRRRLGEYVPNLLTKFNPVRGFIRYFYTSIDVDFPIVPYLLTKFNPVPVDFLVRAQKSDSVLLKLAEISRKRIRFLRAH